MNYTKITTVAAMILAGSASAAFSATNWDLPLAWPADNYIVKNAQVFADRVKETTNGEVVITLHPSGSLGFKGPEMVSVVRDGLAPIGDMLLNQQVGENALFGVQSLPYLIDSFEDLKAFDTMYRPVLDEVFQQNNQKLLYTVPWPQQQIYTKKEIKTVADLSGVKIRSYDKSSTEIFEAAKMIAVQLPWGEVIPSLAAGVIDAVATSSPSAVDGSFWEFLKYGYTTRQTWNTNAVTVNLDAWNALGDAERKAIEDAASSLQDSFWQSAADADAANMAKLAEHGLENRDLDAETRAKLKELAGPLREAALAGMDGKARELVEAFEAR